MFLQNPFIGFKDFHLLEKQILDPSVLGCSLKIFKLSMYLLKETIKNAHNILVVKAKGFQKTSK